MGVRSVSFGSRSGPEGPVVLLSGAGGSGGGTRTRDPPSMSRVPGQLSQTAEPPYGPEPETPSFVCADGRGLGVRASRASGSQVRPVAARGARPTGVGPRVPHGDRSDRRPARGVDRPPRPVRVRARRDRAGGWAQVRTMARRGVDAAD